MNRSAVERRIRASLLLAYFFFVVNERNEISTPLST
jgi:hypothetical protein